LEYWSSHYLGYTMSTYTGTSPITYLIQKKCLPLQAGSPGTIDHNWHMLRRQIRITICFKFESACPIFLGGFSPPPPPPPHQKSNGPYPNLCPYLSTGWVKFNMAERPKSEERQCTKPVCIITLGMAGTGKTTFVQVVLACS
jgi:hypothetical protein